MTTLDDASATWRVARIALDNNPNDPGLQATCESARIALVAAAGRTPGFFVVCNKKSGEYSVAHYTGNTWLTPGTEDVTADILYCQRYTIINRVHLPSCPPEE